MLNIPESVKTLFRRDGVHKNFRVHFPNGEYPDITNEHVVQESVMFSESLSSQDQFRFGLAETSVLEFETVGFPNMYGMTVEASVEIDVSSLSDEQIAEIEAGTWDGGLGFYEGNNLLNLANKAASTIAGASLSVSNGVVMVRRISQSSSSASFSLYGTLDMKPGEVYTLSLSGNIPSDIWWYFYYTKTNGSTGLLASLNSSTPSVTLTMPSDYASGRQRPLSVTVGSNQGDAMVCVRLGQPVRIYSIPLGTFRIESCPRNHGAMTHRKVTAYSDPGIANPVRFPDGPWESWKITRRHIYAIFDKSYRLNERDITLSQMPTYTGPSQLSPAPGMMIGPFYGGTASPIYINVYDADDGNSPMVYYANVGTFFSLEAFPIGDITPYANFGNWLGQQLNASSYSINGNGGISGGATFNSNSEAAHTMHGELWTGFSCFGIKYDASFGTPYEVMPYSMDIGTGGLFISKGYSSFDAMVAIMKNASGSNVRVTLDRFDGVDQYGNRLFTRLQTWLYSASTLPVGLSKNVHTFSVASWQDAVTFRILPSAEGKRKLLVRNNADTESKIREDVVRSFVTDITWQDLLADATEASGMVVKVNRFGSMEIIALDPTSPIPITADDYSEVWWDEYDISPIGTVTAAYSNDEEGESVADISIGDGLSRYDMTSNSFLRNLEDGSAENVASILSGDFATNAANVGFTPIDMTMRGLPWIEAGDALEITAEDGTVVNTYALRIEMSGIQHLTAVVEARGGTIIGEV